MISTLMTTPYEMSQYLAQKSKAKRLSMNLSQKTLSDRSGVSYGVLKKFERTGLISLESLLKLALPLDSLDNFHHLFKEKTREQALSLDELMNDTTRQRGRK